MSGREGPYKRDFNTTSYVHPKDENLNNLHKAMTYDEAGEPHIRVALGSDTITISGNVNVGSEVSISNTSENPVPVTITDTEIEIKNDANNPIPISRTTSANASDNPLYVNFTNSTIGVTGTFWQATQPVSGTVTVQDGGGSITVDGTVTATITDVITVIAGEDPGELYAFNNHAANANRGWTMDEVMRPVVSFQNGSTSAADIIKIVEYEIGNNNANQSTIVYEWYEGPLTISGAAIPAWTTFGQHSQYRVYQDKYSSNQGNTFTVPNGNGTYMRHSGIIIGKNTSGDEGPANLRGGDSRNMLTLCMRRVDNSTKLDVWFAFTVKELT